MLRYFYILVCIQLCFCSVYIDKPDYESQSRSVRSKIAKSPKKLRRDSKKTRLVQFDVQKFMRRPDDDALDYEPNTYGNKERENRGTLANYYGSLIEPHRDRIAKDADIDYTNTDDHISGLNTRSSSNKVPNSKHFNLVYDEKKTLKSHAKAVSNTPSKLLTENEQEIANPEKKCAFRHMKMPFFSFNKSTSKAKRQKKRKQFGLNFHKKHNKVKKPLNQLRATEHRNDIYNKDDKPHPDVRKISKRSYDSLCPKCIKELLNSFKKTTTKAECQKTKASKPTGKDKATVLKVDNLEDNLQDRKDYVSNERYKRGDEESERERRLQELEEVEKKIENVHITAPTFSRVSFSVKL